MSEELKQEIVITVTEADFKRHNPDIEIDEMRMFTFVDKIRFVVQNKLDGLGERYHTCISIENTRPSPDQSETEHFLSEYVKMAQVCVEKDGLEQSLSYMRMKSALETIAQCPIKELDK